ncbi:hypothetical protein V6N13_076320 [Hibiscus sabdariffa]
MQASEKHLRLISDCCVQDSRSNLSSVKASYGLKFEVKNSVVPMGETANRASLETTGEVEMWSPPIPTALFSRTK